MQDNGKNRRWLKDHKNWRYRSPSVIQLRSPDTHEFIDWFQIRASKASPVAAVDIGDGLFFIGGSAAKGQLIGYCSGRQIGPVSAWDEENDFCRTHTDKVSRSVFNRFCNLFLTGFHSQVIELENEMFRPAEWDVLPIQVMSHGTQKKGPVYLDLADGNTGSMQKINHAKYIEGDASCVVNTYANAQGFAVVWKDIVSGEEVLWDYGNKYWATSSDEDVAGPERLYAQQVPEHARVRRHPTLRHTVMMDTMKAMIASAGFVLYKLEDVEFNNMLNEIDPRYHNTGFIKKPSQKESAIGWRAIFNTDFEFSAGPKRWQGPIEWDSSLMPSFVSDVDQASEVDGEFTQPNLMETDHLTPSQLYHYDHEPVISSYKPVEIGFAIIAIGSDVFLDVVPGSHKFEASWAGSFEYLVSDPMAEGRRIRIPPGHAILAHPLLIHAGTNGVGERSHTRRVHLYRRPRFLSRIESTYPVYRSDNNVVKPISREEAPADESVGSTASASAASASTESVASTEPVGSAASVASTESVVDMTAASEDDDEIEYVGTLPADVAASVGSSVADKGKSKRKATSLAIQKPVNVVRQQNAFVSAASKMTPSTICESDSDSDCVPVKLLRGSWRDDPDLD